MHTLSMIARSRAPLQSHGIITDGIGGGQHAVDWTRFLSAPSSMPSSSLPPLFVNWLEWPATVGVDHQRDKARVAQHQPLQKKTK